MNVIAGTNKPYTCDFCNRSFIRESTIEKHICEYKHRWQEKDKRGNQIGFQAWINFYKANTATSKKRTYLDFIKSSYYTAFAKFGTYCVDVHVINVNRYVEWLLKNKVRIDDWNKDSFYTKFLVQYLREEDPLDAIARSISTANELAQTERILFNDYLKYGNKNVICKNITTGKISPWLLYQSQSGLQFIDSLNELQVTMILDYINPELWAVRFHRDVEKTKEVRDLLEKSKF